MGRKVVMYGFGAIALYLLLTNFTGAVKDTNAGANGGIGLIKAFQGR